MSLRRTASALSLAMLLSVCTAVAAPVAQPPFTFGSGGGYAARPLPPHTRDVELLQQRGGVCRFGRTWGFDPARGELWVDQGCIGVFRALVEAPTAGGARPPAADAAAAAAALGGMAILAQRPRPQPAAPDPYATGWTGIVGSAPAGPPSMATPPPGTGRPPGAGRPPPPQAGTLIRGFGGLCLDFHGEPPGPGSPALMWRCTGQSSQRFTWLPRGELRTDAGLCLEVATARPVNGTPVVAARCSGRTAQLWFYDRGTVRSRLDGRCLDARSGRPQPGTPVQTWDCHGQANQLWRG
jgi:hypothetical protein